MPAVRPDRRKIVNPAKMLKKILVMIEADLVTIESIRSGKESRWQQLDDKTSNKIVKYASLLRDLIDTAERSKDEKTKEYSKLTNEQIIELLQSSKTAVKKYSDIIVEHKTVNESTAIVTTDPVIPETRNSHDMYFKKEDKK